MNSVIIILIILSLAILACGSSAPQLKTADDYVKEYGGNVNVYSRILSSKNCVALQTKFDEAEANTQILQPDTKEYKFSLGYMKAAEKRMKDIACYR